MNENDNFTLVEDHWIQFSHSQSLKNFTKNKSNVSQKFANENWSVYFLEN